MSNSFHMLSRLIDLYCVKSRALQSEYDYSYGTLSIHLADEGYEYSLDSDDSETRYPIESVTQLRELLIMIDNEN
jgi:hypothetical protein